MPHSDDLPASPTPFPMLAGEEVIFRVRPSFAPTLFLLIGAGVLGVVLILALNQTSSIIGANIVLILQGLIAIVVGFALLVIFLNWFTTFYTLTNKRVDERYGIIGQHSSSIGVKEISDIKVKIGVVGLLFSYGDVLVTGANETASVDFRYIGQPKLRASQIEVAHTNSLHEDGP